MSKKNKVKPPGAAREVGSVEPDTEKTAVEVSNELDSDAEKAAEPEQEYPCVAPKASIVGAGCVLVAGQKIGPSDIHSDPVVAREHFYSLVERGLILRKAPE